MIQWGRNNPVLTEKQCAYTLLMTSVGLKVRVMGSEYFDIYLFIQNISIFTKLSATSLVAGF